MRQPYNLTITNQTEDLMQMAQLANSAADGYLFALLNLAIFAIIFISASFRIQPSRACALAGFISMICGIMFTVMGLLNPQYMYFTIVLLGIGVLWSMIDNG